MKISLSSTDPKEFHATKLAFERIFPNQYLEYTAIDITSSEDPIALNDQILQQALTRALTTLEKTQAEFCVGIVSGIENLRHGNFTRTWCAITNKEKKIGIGSGVAIPVPKKLMRKLSGSDTISAAEIWSVLMSKNNTQENASSSVSQMLQIYITSNQLSLIDVYRDMIIAALSPFYHADAFELGDEKKKVYIARSISKDHRNHEVSEQITHILNALGHTVLSHHSASQIQPRSLVHQPDPENYQSDIEQLKNADVVIAEVTNPEIGIGFEIAYAITQRKPVIALWKNNPHKNIHPLIAAQKSQYVKIYRYDLENVEQVLKQALMYF